MEKHHSLIQYKLAFEPLLALPHLDNLSHSPDQLHQSSSGLLVPQYLMDIELHIDPHHTTVLNVHYWPFCDYAKDFLNTNKGNIPV